MSRLGAGHTHFKLVRLAEAGSGRLGGGKKILRDMVDGL